MTVAAGLRAHPENGWVAAVLPDAARRIRVVGDGRLAATLAAAGAAVGAHAPDVEIGPADRIAGDAPLAIVPLASLGPLRGPQLARLARRLVAALAVRVRAGRARQVLRRHYPRTAVVRWDLLQTVRQSGVGGPRRQAVEFLPRAAVVTGSHADVGPTLYELAVREASSGIGTSLETSRPFATGGGSLIALSGSHVLRVAVGPGRLHLVRHDESLTQLWARRPAALVAARLPRPLAQGERGLATWLLENRLPGAVPPAVAGALAEDCVEFLVALHGCGRGVGGAPLTRAADVVNVLSGRRHDGLRRLAEWLDDELVGLPRGFAHGDFWRRNLLVEHGRLVGVVDWEHAGDGRLPLLDLLQLATRRRDEGRGVTSLVGRRLLPWARAGGDATVRRYCQRLGVHLTPALLERLVLAFWLDCLARELEKCGDRGGSPQWAILNVDPVLAAMGIERV